MAVLNVRLGTVQSNMVLALNKVATLANELKVDHNALLAKLDLDAGVTDVNFAALHTASSADADTVATVY